MRGHKIHTLKLENNTARNRTTKLQPVLEAAITLWSMIWLRA